MADDDGPLMTTEAMLSAFEQGYPAPDLLSWRLWQVWRAGDGRRPAIRRGDSVTTSIQQESAMWKEVMEAVHGPDWRVELRASNQDAGIAGSTELLGEDGSEVPAARSGAVGTSAAASAPAAATTGGSRSLNAETVSSGRPGAEILRRRLLIDVDPAQDDLTAFGLRIDRIAAALDLQGCMPPEQEIAEIKYRAEYMFMIHGIAGDAQVTYLKDQFSHVLLAEDLGENERASRSRALIELLRVRGQKTSQSAEKMFSTASNSKDPTPDKHGPSLAQRILNPTPITTPQPKRSASGEKRERAADNRSSAGYSMGESGGNDSPRSKHRNVRGSYDDDRYSQSASPQQDALAEAITAQTAAMMQMMKESKKKAVSSTIRVNPTIQWPKLTDEGPDSREVEDFFDKFEDTCGLANDGAGMSDMERLKVLASCLKGSREATYKVLHRKHRLLGDVESDPGMVFSIIKAKLMRFVETPIEKQMRVLSEIDNLQKGKLSALQFEPLWEQCLAELETVSLGRSVRELMLNYLTKMGPSLAAEIQRDMRMWPDGKGGLISRRVGTWEECRDVCMEIESLKQDSLRLWCLFRMPRPAKARARARRRRKAKAAGLMTALQDCRTAWRVQSR